MQQDDVKKAILDLQKQRDEEIEAVTSDIRQRYNHDIRRLSAGLAAKTRQVESQAWKDAVLPALDFLLKATPELGRQTQFKLSMGDKIFSYRNALWQVEVQAQIHLASGSNGEAAVWILMKRLENGRYVSQTCSLWNASVSCKASESDWQKALVQVAHEQINQLEKKIQTGWRPKEFHTRS